MTSLHVIFGTGPLGRAVAAALTRRGHRVRLVNRSGQASGLPPGADIVRADALIPAEAQAATHGAAAVYQCAQPPYHDWPARFPALQDAILGAAQSAGARLVVADNLYLYGPHEGPLTESLPHAATTRKGMVRARMATALLDAHVRGEVEVTIGRGSDFFGPHVLMSTLGERVFGPVVSGTTAAVPGDPDQLHTYTFVEDFGEALAVLGERPEAVGRAWHVPSPPARTPRSIVERAFELAGHAARLRSEGRVTMRLAGLFVPAARETVEMMYAFEAPFVVDHSAYATAFGDHATGWDEALERTVAWYRRR